MTTLPGKKLFQVERRYIQEFIEEYFKKKQWFRLNMRVGPIKEELLRRFPTMPPSMFKTSLLTADAVVVQEGVLYIVEAKIYQPITGLGELLIYRDSISETEELRPYWKLRKHMILVKPFESLNLDRKIQRYGVEVIIYHPLWVLEYAKRRGYNL